MTPQEKRKITLDSNKDIRLRTVECIRQNGAWLHFTIKGLTEQIAPDLQKKPKELKDQVEWRKAREENELKEFLK